MDPLILIVIGRCKTFKAFVKANHAWMFIALHDNFRSMGKADWKKLVDLISSVEGRTAKINLWAEFIGASQAPDAARIIDNAVRSAAFREPGAVSAYLCLLDLPAVAAGAGSGKLAAVLAAAQESFLEGTLLLLENPERAARLRPEERAVDPILESVSLGHRKTIARSPRSPILERVLKDPDPRVVEQALRNPRLREREVLAVASRRPCEEPIFWMLLRSQRWSLHMPIQRAIVRNPHAPQRLAVGLAVLLLDTDLIEIIQDDDASAAIAGAARTTLEWRRKEH